uniref:Uncharacterized protein n=1 Tax=Oryzias latipes TaxID=8090 RepID=A0A3P9KHG1_ORYLA
MSLMVKASLLGKYEQVKEIRRFLVDQDVCSSFEKLSRQTAAVFSKLKNSSFSLFYKGEPHDRFFYFFIISLLLLLFIYLFSHLNFAALSPWP